MSEAMPQHRKRRLPQIGADNAKIEAAVQRYEAPDSGFSGDTRGDSHEAADRGCERSV